MEKKYSSNVLVSDSLVIGNPEISAGFICIAEGIYVASLRKPSDAHRLALEETFGFKWLECDQVFGLADKEEQKLKVA